MHTEELARVPTSLKGCLDLCANIHDRMSRRAVPWRRRCPGDTFCRAVATAMLRQILCCAERTALRRQLQMPCRCDSSAHATTVTMMVCTGSCTGDCTAVAQAVPWDSPSPTLRGFRAAVPSYCGCADVSFPALTMGNGLLHGIG